MRGDQTVACYAATGRSCSQETRPSGVLIGSSGRALMVMVVRHVQRLKQYPGGTGYIVYRGVERHLVGP